MSLSRSNHPPESRAWAQLHAQPARVNPHPSSVAPIRRPTAKGTESYDYETKRL